MCTSFLFIQGYFQNFVFLFKIMCRRFNVYDIFICCCFSGAYHIDKCNLYSDLYQMSVYANNVAVFDYKDARLYFGLYAIHELVPFLVVSFIFLVIGRGFNKYWMRYK